MLVRSLMYVSKAAASSFLTEGISDDAGTVQSFLSGVVREHEIENLSTVALHAKAAALYEKSYSLVTSLESGVLNHLLHTGRPSNLVSSSS